MLISDTYGPYSVPVVFQASSLMGRDIRVPIIPIRILGPPRLKSQCQSQMAGKKQRWDLSPGVLAPNPPLESYSLLACK